MIIQILKKEYQRKKLIHFSLFLFILLPALLLSSAAGLLTNLSGAMTEFFDNAGVPHFVQMHAGPVDYEQIRQWCSDQPLIENWQIVEMVNIDGSSLLFENGSKTLSSSLSNSVMDIGFVRQNRDFDYLLDLNNDPVSISQGEIAVPLYFMESENLQIGDSVTILYDDFSMSFRISDFIRDSQMNPSIIHSKRFVLHEADFNTVKSRPGELEYLIEFRLKDLDSINNFANLYENSGLPGTGPSINFGLFQIVNGITDGITITIIALISVLFCIVAVLCLRFSIISSLEEEYREIGVMKAIGFPADYIRRIYWTKYSLIALSAAVSGYLLSFLLNAFLNSNILLYMGSIPGNIMTYTIPLLTSFAVLATVWISCLIILRRFRTITAMEAIRAGRTTCKSRHVRRFSLQTVRRINVNVFLGLRDLFLRFRMFWLLGFIFFFCSFIILVPINFLNTIQSPTFIQYLGIGRCDIRIDLKYSANIQERYAQLIETIESDKDISLYTPMITSQYKIRDADGVLTSFNIESGDYTKFPLNYVDGHAPIEDTDIALSLLNAQDLNLSVGEYLEVYSDTDKKRLRVSGLYQDITNGGYTAKTAMAPGKTPILWYVINLNLKEDVHRPRQALFQEQIQEKIQEYADLFYPARVTHTSTYIRQTLGNTIEQLKTITNMITLIGFFVVMLITALFLKMIMAKDSAQIAIMRGLGFSQGDITVQYITRSLILLITGVASGTIAANTLGTPLISSIWAVMGASEIRLLADPLKSYIIFPLSLTVMVTIVTLMITSKSGKTSISEMNAE